MTMKQTMKGINTHIYDYTMDYKEPKTHTHMTMKYTIKGIHTYIYI